VSCISMLPPLCRIQFLDCSFKFEIFYQPPNRIKQSHKKRYQVQHQRLQQTETSHLTPQPSQQPFRHPIKMSSQSEPEPDPTPPHHREPISTEHTTTTTNHDQNGEEPSSPDSEDLHEARPNRWRGHPSTWRTWTEKDRQTWTALENVRKEELGVHLYNAYGLREGFRRGPDVGEVRFFFLWFFGGGGFGGLGWGGVVVEGRPEGVRRRGLLFACLLCRGERREGWADDNRMKTRPRGGGLESPGLRGR
jgi:hypothetical protein